MSKFRNGLLVVLLIAIQTYMHGQCAMCRATAESASESVDKGIGEGLNSGIVYLMVIPYLLLMVGGLVFFRKKIAVFFRQESANS